MKKILSCMRRTMQQYEMVQSGETIAVGLSGGKDSMLLLHAMALLRRFYPAKFELMAIHLDMGFESSNTAALETFCAERNVPLSIIKTQIGKVIFEERKEKNPCALCARMKRGALHDRMLKLGVHKLAFGHHADDALETLMLCLFYEGRFHTFQPVTYLDKKEITLIRPMIYVRESEIIYQSNKLKLPCLEKGCPADGHTKRTEMKELMRRLTRKIPKADERILDAMENKDQFALWFNMQDIE
jgi:tRNA(Ile)-lysidine synthase TilS/MesJ